MALIKCDICGEKYSDTYHTCPFCEEEEAMRSGKPIQRRAKDFRNKRGHHALGVLSLLAVVIVVGCGTFFFFGDNIAAALGIRETNPVEDPDGGVNSYVPDDDESDNQEGDGVQDPDGDGEVNMPEGPDGETTDPDDSDDGQEQTPPATPVTISSEDVTMSLGQKTTFTASGGSGTYTWSSSDTTKVTVVDGVVTIVGRASSQTNVTVTVTDGYTSAECIVRVKGGTPVNGSEQQTTSGLELNRTDMTISKGETFTLKVSGTTSQVTWSIGDSSVASITADGIVKGINSGNTTVTAKVDGQTLKCIVRVK